jgi:hypothetical protein
VSQIADLMRADAEFRQVAELYVGTPDLDLTDLISELITGEAVPFLAAHRYTDSGFRKRAQWEKTWELQRQEDAGIDVGKIPVPPKFGNADYSSKIYWSLRGKLDVPKERFISYPGLSRDTDPTLLVGWAGWDHLQQAQALADTYRQRRSLDVWKGDRLVPILAGMAELAPWLLQWHNDPDPTGERPGTSFDRLITHQCEILGIPRDTLTTTQPTALKAKGRELA